MADWGIEISHEAERLVARLNEAPRISADVIEKNLRTVGGGIARAMVKVLDVVKYKGTLARSVSTEYSAEPPYYTIRIGPTAPHAQVVRTGSRPHWAPIAPLKEWAKWKLGDEHAAYAVQKSIAKKGTSMYLLKKGLGERTEYGIGYDYPGRTLARGDVQLIIERTSQRIPLEFVGKLEASD
jgi:hypothetical protein